MGKYKKLTIDVKRNEDGSFIWNNRNGVKIWLNEESGDVEFKKYLEREWANDETTNSGLTAPITKCSCEEDDKTGQTSVMCCNVCGLPDENFWHGGSKDICDCDFPIVRTNCDGGEYCGNCELNIKQ